MTAPEAPEASSAAVPGISPVAAVVGVFSKPDDTFGRLVKKPTWWLPFVLYMLAVFGSALVITPKIDMARSMHEMLSRRGMSDEQIETVIKQQGERSPVAGAAYGAAGFGVVFLVVGLVFWGSVRAMGAEARFSQVLAIWGHASLVNVAGTLVAIPLFLSVPDASMTQKAAGQFVKSNVGAFLPDSWPTFVVSLLSSIDLFSIACLALLAIGFRKLPELGKGGAIGVTVTLYVLYSLAKAALAAVFMG